MEKTHNASNAANFERSLRLFDDKLAVRWGNKIGRWVIARKSYIPPSEIGFLRSRQARFDRWCREKPEDNARQTVFSEITEELASANEGRRIILYADSLDRRIFDMLVQSDIRRYGGYARFADEMEKLDKIKEDRAEHARSSHTHDLNREVYDQMDFIERRRTTDLDYGKSWKEMLASGTRSPAPTGEKLTVIDRRAVKPEPSEVRI